MSQSKPSTLIEQILPLAVLFTVLLIAILTVYPFLPAILWGGMLAIAIEPRYRWLSSRLGNRPVLAAWLSGLFLTLLFVIPAAGLSRALLAFLPDALNWLESQTMNASNRIPTPFHDLPSFGPHITAMWHSLFDDAGALTSQFGDELKAFLLWLLHELEIFGVFVFEFAIGILLAVLLAYRAERISELAGKFLDRLGGKFAQRLAANSVKTTRSAVRGVLGAALAQTLVATFSYVVAGVPGWMIWAGLTFVLSLVQVGPVLIWVPMSLWLWASDQPYMAAFVFLWGLIVVNLTDNIVRPVLVSKDSDLPAILAFIGAVGGLLQWGVVGVFLGPVIVAVGYDLILKWIEPETLTKETIS